MEITVYLDLIFLINFCVEFYVLIITNRLMKMKASVLRIGFGALLESLVFLPLITHAGLLTGVPGIVLSIVISMGTVRIALGGAGGLVKKWFLSTTVMVAFGGVFQLLKNVLPAQKMTIYIWIIIFLLSGIIMILFVREIVDVKYRTGSIYCVKIIHGERAVECNMFLDTGNRLRDNLFGKPVMLLSYEIVEKILSDKEIEFINEYKKKGYIDYQNPIVLNSQKNICFHEITYKSVGKSSGRLLCFLLDKIELCDVRKLYIRQPAAVVDAELFEGREYKGLIFSDDI